jgi:hypothetical protein
MPRTLLTLFFFFGSLPATCLLQAQANTDRPELSSRADNLFLKMQVEEIRGPDQLDGTGSLTGNIQITPDDVDPSTEAATVEFSPASLAGLTERVPPVATSASPTPVTVPPMNLIDTGEYVLALATGTVRTVRYVRRIQVDRETVRVESTEIALQPED